MKTLLSVESIHAHYGKSHVLQGVSLQVQDGELVTLLGRNGAGKTTTLKSIAGVMQQGRVLAEGLPHEIRNDERVRSAYLGNMITGGKA